MHIIEDYDKDHAFFNQTYTEHINSHGNSKKDIESHQ